MKSAHERDVDSRTADEVAQLASLSREEARVEAEYGRRASEISKELYAPWRHEVSQARASRVEWAACLLNRIGAFPGPSTPCLEIGVGELGWLSDLLAWGVREHSLHGLDLGLNRLAALKRSLPSVHTVASNGGRMPYGDSSFGLVIASTLFTSILDEGVRRLVAGEIFRCLRPGGAVLIYDFCFDNPRNAQVRALGKAEVCRLFPTLRGVFRRVTLAPPIARRLAPLSRNLTALLEAVPFLRSHLLAVLRKPL